MFNFPLQIHHDINYHVKCFTILIGAADANLLIIWRDIELAYEELSIPSRYANIVLSMFTNPDQPHLHYPALKGKAAELRHLAGPMLLVWQKYMDTTNLQHVQIQLVLEKSREMEQILSDNPSCVRLPEPLRSELVQLGFDFLIIYNSLAYHYATLAPARRLFNITIKFHYFAHTLLQSRWLNVRFGWCYSGEDFMQQCKRVHLRCAKGAKGDLVQIKFAKMYRHGLHFEYGGSLQRVG